MSMLINEVARQLDSSKAAAFKKEANRCLKEIHTENPDIPKSFRMHTDMNIFPAIAAYKTMRSYEIDSKQAIDYISSAFNGYCDKYASVLRFGINLLHLEHKIPSMFVKISLKAYAPGKNGDLGFSYRLPENQDKRIARFDITSCPYLKICEKYNCTEIMRAFCDSDDHKYGNMSKKLLWNRTGTIGKGSECCDFRLVDISRYPDYQKKVSH